MKKTKLNFNTFTSIKNILKYLKMSKLKINKYIVWEPSQSLLGLFGEIKLKQVLLQVYFNDKCLIKGIKNHVFILYTLWKYV